MDQKVRGVLAYVFSILGGIIVLCAFKDNTKETNFNACQSIVLGAIYFILSVVVGFVLGFIYGILVAAGAPFAGFLQVIINLVSWALRIGFLALSLIGIIRAYQETEFSIPLIGDLTKKIFKSKLA